MKPSMSSRSRFGNASRVEADAAHRVGHRFLSVVTNHLFRVTLSMRPVMARDPQKFAAGKRLPSSSHNATASSVRFGGPYCSFNALIAMRPASAPSAPS